MRYLFEWVLVILMILLIYSAYAFSKWQCDSHELTTGNETKFVAMGCYVKYEGKFMRWDEYKSYIAANGLKGG